jgi:hypothetical protein
VISASKEPMPKRAKQIGKTQPQTLKGWQQISDFLGDPEQSHIGRWISAVQNLAS